MRPGLRQQAAAWGLAALRPGESVLQDARLKSKAHSAAAGCVKDSGSRLPHSTVLRTKPLVVAALAALEARSVSRHQAKHSSHLNSCASGSTLEPLTTK